MATVYLAHDPRFGRDVALKAIALGYKDDPTFRSRFEREARTIATLEHPAIVPVYDFGEDNDQLYLVMRHMHSGTLSDRIIQGPMSGDVAIPIVRRIAGALDHAHQNGVVHRDLKPGNILFDEYERAYLSDFGIVKLAAEGTDANLTGSGVIGTPAYMSPEQIHGDELIDGRSDIYTLGVILFEMLTGRKPYRADTPVKQMMAHVMDPIPDIRAILPNFPPECATVIQRALAKDRDSRYQKARDLTLELTSTLTGNAYEPIPRPPKIDSIEHDADTASHDLPTISRDLPTVEHELPTETNYIDAPMVNDDVTMVSTGVKPLFEPAPDATKVNEAKLPVADAPEVDVAVKKRRWPFYLAGLLLTAVIATILIQNRPVIGEETPTATVETAVVAETPPNTVVAENETPDVPETATPTEPAPTETPLPRDGLIGETPLGNPLTVQRLGDGPNLILLVGGIHAGQSPSTIAVVDALYEQLQADERLIPSDVTMLFISNINPDSSDSGEFTNSNGVDINRNWDCDWQANPTVQGIAAIGLGGKRPFSEPETVLLQQLILSEQPEMVIILDAAVRTGWVSAGNCGGQTRSSRPFELLFANSAGYLSGDITTLQGQEPTGNAAGWIDSQGIPAITVWLPSRETAVLAPNLAGLLAIMEQISNE